MSSTIDIVENQPYSGSIVDQGLIKAKSGKWYSKFTVGLKAKVTNTAKPSEGAEPIKYREVDVLSELDAANPKMFDWRLNDLKRLGFTGNDLTVLDPGHEEHQSFVGKEVVLAATIKERGDDVKVYWNFVFPKQSKSLGAKDLEAAAKALNKHVEKANERLAKRDGKPKEEAAGVPF